MKIKSILFAMVAAIFALTSCEQDNEGAIYNQGNQGVSFLFNTESSSAPASNPLVYITVVRSKSDAAATVGVSGSSSAPGVSVNPTVSFEAGSKESQVVVDLGSELEVGVKASVKITIDDADASIGGVKTVTLTAYKEYEWESIGTGGFVDNWVCPSSAHDAYLHEVEIQQAKGFARYRVMDPYKECYTNDDGDWGDWCKPALRPKYIEFWELADGESIRFDSFSTGLYYDGSTSINYYYYSDLTSSVSSDHSMKVAEGVYQLAPYIYMPEVGGWNKTQVDGLVYIILPD